MRSIPACTGKPPSAGLSAKRRQGVYPRVYGETRIVIQQIKPYEGLSPRVRGNPQQARRARRPTRVYPRVYGETPIAVTRSNRMRRVYPRVYGETRTRTRHRLSPHWGVYPRVYGETPPCVSPRPVCPWSRVYPRVYGETRHRPPMASRTVPGLSPRVRGNPSVHPRCHPHPGKLGSIPACTGKPRMSEVSRGWHGSIPACTGKPRPA